MKLFLEEYGAVLCSAIVVSLLFVSFIIICNKMEVFTILSLNHLFEI